MMSDTPPILIVPGLGDSPPGHWQDLWLRRVPNATKVEQDDWDDPHLCKWLSNLSAALERFPGAILVGHSLGCSAIVRLAVLPAARWVRGALLVAPPDLELRTPIQGRLADFAPMPLTPLPFAALVVASADDPYVSLRRARVFAQAWGAELVSLGLAGHINIASGHGHWPWGQELLRSLIERSHTQYVA
jgi:predicted alpha/beta hydrolase family esterase